MELLWEYTFPVISRGASTTLQKGTDNLVGVAIADYPDMPPSLPTILIGGRKMFSLPKSARTRRASFFEMDLMKKQVTISSMRVSNIYPYSLRLFYDQERAIWLSELERSLPRSDGLEIYEIHPEEDPQWLHSVAIKGDQMDVGDNHCVAFWKTNTELQCIFVIPDVGESDDDQLFWATWSLQMAEKKETIRAIGYTDTIFVHITDQGCLLFLYQRLLDGVETPFSGRRGSGKWQLSCIAYDNTGHLLHQEVIPQLTTHIRDLKLPADDLYEAFLLQVVVESGPLYGPEQQPTCVVVATRKEKVPAVSSEEQGNTEIKSKREDQLTALQHTVGRLLWMDQLGHILWADDEPLGEQVTLCCYGDTVVGADLLEGRWRLWYWVPSAETGIYGETPFPTDVIKVTVLAEEGPLRGDDQSFFWCLEQYDRGLRVVQRDCKQGNEVEALWCEGFTLFCEWTGIRMEKCQGTVLSERRLVLLGHDQDEKIKLIYIQ